MTQAATAPKDDPNLVIPKAVRAQSQHADRLHAHATGKQNATTQADPAAPAATPPASPGATPSPAPAATPSPAPAASGEDWEHKYKSLKGKFDAETQRLGHANDVLTGRLQALEEMMASMNTPQAQMEDPITPEDRQAYGEEFIAAVRRSARAEFQDEIRDLKSQLEQLSGKVKTVGGEVAKTAREKMFVAMDSGLADWRKINHDPKFIAWLDLRDPMSGAIRNELLSAALAANDAQRVLAFFRGFLREEAATASASSDSTPATPTVSNLADFAAPGRASGTAATPPSNEKPFITRAQIAAFYADVAAGRYRGREDEKNKQEQILFAAQREGRVR